MKTSTLLFNVAAVVAVLAIFIALVDLVKPKAKPRVVYTATPMVTLAPVMTSTPAADALEEEVTYDDEGFGPEYDE